MCKFKSVQQTPVHPWMHFDHGDAILGDDVQMMIAVAPVPVFQPDVNRLDDDVRDLASAWLTGFDHQGGIARMRFVIEGHSQQRHILGNGPGRSARLEGLDIHHRSAAGTFEPRAELFPFFFGYLKDRHGEPGESFFVL